METDFETRIAELVKTHNERYTGREDAAFVRGLVRALVIAVGRDRADEVLAAHGIDS